MLNPDEVKYISNYKLLTSGLDAVSRIAEGHSPSCQAQRLWQLSGEELLNQSKLDQSADALRLPPLELFSFANVELRSDFMPYRHGAPMTDDRMFPEYIKRYFDTGLVRGFADVQEVREVDETVFCMSHFNMRTYGHFLLEVLPKVLLANELQRAGFEIPVVFPSDAGPISDIIAYLCEPESLLLYESKREILRPSSVIVPSMMISSDYRGHFHNLFIALIRRLSFQYSVSPSATIVPGPILFLSRTKWKGYRTATNEAELFKVAADYDFELVHPQDFTWPDQVKMFYGASHVISAYDSALHGTIFCQAGAKIISLGRVNELQEGIASSLGHEIGFLHPVKGEISLYDPDEPKPQNYEIDPEQLRHRLEVIMLG